jgi:hypothetical protein
MTAAATIARAIVMIVRWALAQWLAAVDFQPLRLSFFACAVFVC